MLSSLATAAEKEESAIEGTINGLQGWVDNFKRSELKEVVRGNNLFNVGDVKENPALIEVHELGKSV